jgi:hypothetical protein
MIRTRMTLPGVVALLGACLFATCGAQTPSSPASGGPSVSESGQATVDYLRDIRPILSNACYQCHGPDEESREADLRLDQKAGALGATASGSLVLVPGKPRQSELLRRIESDDADARMPPRDSGKSLSPEQIALIRKWIEEGAPWRAHWAFVAPQRPSVPVVSDASWPRTAIDSFVLAALDNKGWKPGPEADKETLLRRVTLHLAGLPPTLAEVDAFLADDSPAAYERVIDRLLASPHYGEHMARFWLDGARYGDTHGLHLDNYREMWLYRDWVVGAFNSNLPYDQFVIQQLGGDLLPNPTIQQRIATGFCRSNVSTNEGGSIEEEVYVRNVVDRVDTLGTALLGLTIGCARCHDHKFDPITQKEYYQLFAFFNSLDGPSLDGNVKDPAPVVNVPDAATEAKLAGLRRVIDATRAECRTIEAMDDAGYNRWLATFAAKRGDGAEAEVPVRDGMVVQCNFDGKDPKAINRADPKNPGSLVGTPASVDGPAGKALEISRENYVDLGNVGDFQDDQAFSYGAWIKASSDAPGAILAKTDSGDLFKGYELTIGDGLVRTQMGRRDPGYLITVVTKQRVITTNEWHHIFVTYDGSRLASGLVIYVDGTRRGVDVYSDALKYKNGIRNSKPLLLGRRDIESAFEGGQIDDARVYNRRLTDGEVETIFLSTHLEPLRGTPRDQWPGKALQSLRRFYLLGHDSTFGAYCGEIDRLTSQVQREEGNSPTTLVFREQRHPREAFVLVRGQYDLRGEKVERRTPEAMPAMNDGQPRNRLGLAGWLVSPEHPLTSRVAVNRFWQQLFGTGLVKTSEDFGNQGALPSHPELLDWLAVDFRESGWDVKRLVKQIVTSAAYRQSSRVSAQRAAEDPENRFLSHGPRFRLDAEGLRDQALSVSGLLVTQMGGPSVKPPQPEGLWEAVGFIGSNTAKFVADAEFEKTHRRSLYTFLKRTAPPPEMSTFDAPSREAPCVRRERTNTPMQALLLLNDPQYVEAAQALAAKVMREKKSTSDRAAHMYRLCTARRAAEGTVAELGRLHDEQLAHYRNDEAKARKLNAIGLLNGDEQQDACELAAWTVVGNLMLNLDEVITVN